MYANEGIPLCPALRQRNDKINFDPQGFGSSTAERVPLLARDTMSEAQRLAADAIIAGPRKAIFGPFVPLLQCPELMEHIGKTGEALRFQGHLPERVRELAICVVARETSNQFEWQTHAPLAVKAGVSQTVLDAGFMSAAAREGWPPIWRQPWISSPS